MESRAGRPLCHDTQGVAERSAAQSKDSPTLHIFFSPFPMGRGPGGWAAPCHARRLFPVCGEAHHARPDMHGQRGPKIGDYHLSLVADFRRDAGLERFGAIERIGVHD